MLAFAACVQPIAELQLSSVHTLPSSQTGGGAGMQLALVGSHVSWPLHASLSVQTTGVPDTQSPATQVSLPSQRVRLVQSASDRQHIGMEALTQPRIVSQKSSVQSAPSSQTGGVPAMQPTAGSQVSTPSHASWSSQTCGPATHARSVQLIRPEHRSGSSFELRPVEHVSAPLHALLSLQSLSALHVSKELHQIPLHGLYSCPS